MDTGRCGNTGCARSIADCVVGRCSGCGWLVVAAGYRQSPAASAGHRLLLPVSSHADARIAGGGAVRGRGICMHPETDANCAAGVRVVSSASVVRSRRLARSGESRHLADRLPAAAVGPADVRMVRAVGAECVAQYRADSHPDGVAVLPRIPRRLLACVVDFQPRRPRICEHASRKICCAQNACPMRALRKHEDTRAPRIHKNKSQDKQQRKSRRVKGPGSGRLVRICAASNMDFGSRSSGRESHTPAGA